MSSTLELRHDPAFTASAASGVRMPFSSTPSFRFPSSSFEIEGPDGVEFDGDPARGLDGPQGVDEGFGVPVRPPHDADGRSLIRIPIPMGVDYGGAGGGHD